MFILKKGHQPGVYVPLRALFLVFVTLGHSRLGLVITGYCSIRKQSFCVHEGDGWTFPCPCVCVPGHDGGYNLSV